VVVEVHTAGAAARVVLTDHLLAEAGEPAALRFVQLQLAVGGRLGQQHGTGHGCQRPFARGHAGAAGILVEQGAGFGPVLQPLVLAGQGHVGVLRFLGALEAFAGVDQATDELLDLLGDLLAVGVGAAAQGRLAGVALVVLAFQAQAAGVGRGRFPGAGEGAVVGDHGRLRSAVGGPDGLRRLCQWAHQKHHEQDRGCFAALREHARSHRDL